MRQYKDHFTVVHAAAPGTTLTACCGAAIAELPVFQGVTPDLARVTCPARRAAPLREVIALALHQVRATDAPERPRRHHGTGGHTFDQRCAVCTGDITAMSAAITAAVTGVLRSQVNDLITSLVERPLTPNSPPAPTTSPTEDQT